MSTKEAIERAKKAAEAGNSLVGVLLTLSGLWSDPEEELGKLVRNDAEELGLEEDDLEEIVDGVLAELAKA